MENVMKSNNFDIIGEINGNFGKWQMRTVLLIFLTKIPSAWFMAVIIFSAPAPRDGEFFCHPSVKVLNSHTQEKFERMLDFNKTAWISMMHPTTDSDNDGTNKIDFCNIYADAHKVSEMYFHSLSSITEDWISPNRNDSVIVPCKRFYHHTDFSTLVTDYNLVCNKDILIASTQFFHLFGVLTGGLLATYLLKHFSPKSVMLFGMITQIFCGSMTGLVDSYELHVFFRCLSAICCCQMYTAGGMIFSDITSGKQKTIVVTLFEQFWSIGVILLPLLAHLVKSWSHLYLAISWPTVVLIILWRWIPNSPRWLLANGRIDEVRDILIESAIVNDRKNVLPSNLEFLLRQQAYNMQNQLPPAGWWTLWKGPTASFRNMVCVHICWSIYIITYYGMLLNIRSFSREHLEINTMIAGCCEILGVFVGLILILYTRRKWLYTGLFNIIAGLIAYSAWLIPLDIEVNLRVSLLMLSSMVSKAAISCTLAILTTCTTELVSENQKKICAFSTIVYARIFLLSAPFIGATIVFGQLIPQTSFTTLSIFGGILSTLISSPRTLNTPVKHSNFSKEIFPEIYTIKNFDSLSTTDKPKG
ncbi:solute carrier family 22 member 8-like [Contarinia nasturtii]|uniref:solute carrier family 22 member 8-like n=1 Tax=Contarinia nasturtii TaxID=265458 RepID=UPI0012D4733A|nr:solute carrier family 22 member 8-like [Contarinia nasturtii]XP_031635393.1 solute carrier family 22 member 8-like [Contarinia nasturtii]XP_031635394.1 solute carrier family 22 member 8-like [Contarinia nasturtii]